jgi:hypothetical protein
MESSPVLAAQAHLHLIITLLLLWSHLLALQSGPAPASASL